MAQESLYKRFTELHYPVKLWVITHPFVAKKAMTLSLEARNEAEQRIEDPDLDGDFAGGQVDAFRHVFWMSYLTANIGPRKARKLGQAYERSNKIDFKKKILEDRYLPDFMASEMDLENNETGIRLGIENIVASKNELIQKAKQTVLEGKAVIIKKNIDGQFLNSLGEIIPPEEHLGLWFSSKALVPSNFKRP